jgi:tetratricopeptide (TPR) repeat protein
MSRLRCFLVLLSLPLVTPWAWGAENPRDAFDSANRLYYEGKFAESAVILENLTTNGYASPEVYFNLGNALHKTGKIGQAIVAYRQAASLKPRDADVRANLQFARRQANGPSFEPNIIERAIDRMTINEWTILFSVCLWSLFGLLAFKQWKPAIGGPPSWLYAVLGLGILLSGAGLATALESQHFSKEAIVTAPTAAIRQGPHDSAQVIQNVRDGAELPVIDRKNDWLFVRIDRDRFGWMPRKLAIVCNGSAR